MSIIASITARLNKQSTLETAVSDWWRKLSPAQQKQYVKDHPGSKYAKDAKKLDGLKDALKHSPSVKDAKKISENIKDLENKNKNIKKVPDSKDKTAKKQQLTKLLKSFKEYLARDLAALKKATKEKNAVYIKNYTKAVAKRRQQIESLQNRLSKLG